MPLSGVSEEGRIRSGSDELLGEQQRDVLQRGRAKTALAQGRERAEAVSTNQDGEGIECDATRDCPDDEQAPLALPWESHGDLSAVG